MTAAAAGLYAAALLALAAFDLRRRRVPNRIVLPAAAAVLALHTAAVPSAEWAIAAAGGYAFMAAVSLARPEGLGMGDAKLVLLLGAMLGRGLLVALLVGFAAAALPSLVLLVRGRRRATLPLAPFLALGGLAALPLVLQR